MSQQCSFVDSDRNSILNERNHLRSSVKSNTERGSYGGKLCVKDFDFEKELGRGAFGKVVMAKSKKTNKTYAIKVLNKAYIDSLNKTNEVFAERELLKTLDHPNIIRLYSAFQNSTKLFFVLSYCNNGSLKELIEKNGSLPYKLAQFYTAEIVNVLKYFEEKSVAHRDIKPGNIMLDEELHLKFIDFGTGIQLGKRYDINKKMFVKADPIDSHELVGTPEYASPEMINHKVENEKSCDIWALGCILYHFFHGFSPFKGSNEQETLENITNGEFSFRSNIDSVVKDLISNLLIMDSNKRLGMSSIQEIMSHPFFHGIDFDKLPETPVPKFQKSKSVFCLNTNQNLEDTCEDQPMYYERRTSNHITDSSYLKDRLSINTNTVFSTESTVISSHRDSNCEDELFSNLEGVN